MGMYIWRMLKACFLFIVMCVVAFGETTAPTAATASPEISPSALTAGIVVVAGALLIFFEVRRRHKS